MDSFLPRGGGGGKRRREEENLRFGSGASKFKL